MSRARGGVRAGARRRFERVEVGRRVGVRERQLVGGVDRHDVQVRVRHLLADDEHPDPPRLPFEVLGAADLLRDREQVRGERGLEVDPVVDLVAGDDERVAGHHRRDREERDRAVVLPHELAGQLARDDPAEDARHGPPFGSAYSTRTGAVDRAHDERRRCQPGGGTVARDGARRRRRRPRRVATSPTTQPPKPAPVRRAPYAPARTSASTSASSSGVETRKSSRSDAWLAPMSCAARGRGRRRAARRRSRARARSRRRRDARTDRRRPDRASRRGAWRRRCAAAAASHAARRSAYALSSSRRADSACARRRRRRSAGAGPGRCRGCGSRAAARGRRARTPTPSGPSRRTARRSRACSAACAIERDSRPRRSGNPPISPAVIATATANAALDDKPDPTGTVDVTVGVEADRGSVRSCDNSRSTAASGRPHAGSTARGSSSRRPASRRSRRARRTGRRRGRRPGLGRGRRPRGRWPSAGRSRPGSRCGHRSG